MTGKEYLVRLSAKYMKQPEQKKPVVKKKRSSKKAAK